MTHQQTIRVAAALFVTTLVLSTAAWANGPNTFTLAGTVESTYCPGDPQPDSAKDLATESFRPAPPFCILNLQVASYDGPYRAPLSCSDPGVVEACRWLKPGDPVLVLGSETASGKVATHVALSLHGAPTSAAEDKAQAPELPRPEILELKIGATARLGDLQIRFQEVIEDSRCPEDVTCVWAGRVTVALAAWDGSSIRATTYHLTLGEGPAAAEEEIGSFAVRLEEVLPVPRTEILPIDPSDYSIQLRVWQSDGSGNEL